MREEEGKKGKEGEWVARALRLTRIVVVHLSQGSRRAPPARAVVAGFESRMLMMGMEGGVGSRELARGWGENGWGHWRAMGCWTLGRSTLR